MGLVKLMSAGSHAEAQLVKGLLETEGIPSVVNGESQRTDMGTEAGFAEILILVNDEHLPQARLLLEAKVVAEAPDQPGVIAEGAVCPVHELQAIARCSSCGSHLCAGCGPFGVPARCEACSAQLVQTPPARTGTRVVAWLLLLFLLGVPLVGAAILRLFYDFG